MRTPNTNRRGLTLPPHLGVGKAEETSIQQTWDTAGQIEEELRQRGFAPLTQPTFAAPQVTAELLTTANNLDYTTHYAQQLAWFNYVVPLIAQVRATILGYENEMEDIAVTLRQQEREKNKDRTKEEKLNAEGIQDVIWADARHKELTIALQKFSQRRFQLDAYAECIERNLKVISRQVEIRRQEIEGGKTENNMPNRGRPSNAPSNWRA